MRIAGYSTRDLIDTAALKFRTTIDRDLFLGSNFFPGISPLSSGLLIAMIP